MDLISFLSLVVALVIALSGYLLFYDVPKVESWGSRRRR